MTDITSIPPWAEKDTRGMYLFGSRSMAVREQYVSVKDNSFDLDKISSKITDSTDYDMAAPYSKMLEEMLVSNGWNQIPVEGLYHPCALMKGLFIKSNGGQTVQILLRDNHELFVKAWESIEPEFWYYYIWKRSPEFQFSKFAKKEQKKIITEIIMQVYNTVNVQYGFKKA